MNVFPIILIVLNFGASITYFIGGNPLKGCYWLCALGLNICIYLMK